MRVIVADDEPLARERIRTLLAAVPGMELVAECPDGHRTLEAVRTHRPDLLFLDVQMPGPNGFEALAQLAPVELPLVIFVTAYDEYALRAFEVHAVDYLLKPFDPDRFRQALERAARQLESHADRALRERLQRLLTEAPASFGPQRLAVGSGGRIRFIRVDEIDWIGAAGNYLRLHVGKQEHLLRQPLGALEATLDPARFARVHRSVIVNLDRVRDLEAAFHGDGRLTLADGTRLPLSRTYRDIVLQRLRRT